MQSQVQACGLSTAGIVISNPAEGMDIFLLCLLSVVLVVASATSCSLIQWNSTGCV
jgi:hypothetical protein